MLQQRRRFLQQIIRFLGQILVSFCTNQSSQQISFFMRAGLAWNYLSCCVC